MGKVIHISDALHKRLTTACAGMNTTMRVWAERVLIEALENLECLRPGSTVVKKSKVAPIRVPPAPPAPEPTKEITSDEPKPWERPAFYQQRDPLKFRAFERIQGRHQKAKDAAEGKARGQELVGAGEAAAGDGEEADRGKKEVSEPEGDGSGSEE